MRAIGRPAVPLAMAAAFLLVISGPFAGWAMSGGGAGAGSAPQPQSIDPLSIPVQYSWRTMDGLQTNLLSPRPTYDHLHDVAWAPDGHMAIAVGSHNTLVGWDPILMEARLLRNGTLGNLYGIAWSDDSSTALAVGWNGALVRYAGSGIADLAPQGNTTWQGAVWIPSKGFLVVGDGGGAFFLEGDVRTNVTTGTANDLLAVGYNPLIDRALAVGRAGTVVEITRAGAAAALTSPTTQDLRSVGFEADSGVGHIAGGDDVLLNVSGTTVSNESHLATYGGFYDLSVVDSSRPTVVAVRNATTGAGSLLFTNGSFTNWLQLGTAFAGVESVARSPTQGYVLATGFFGAMQVAWDNGTWWNESLTFRPSLLDAQWRATGDFALMAGLNGTLLLYDKAANTTSTVAVPATNVSLRGVSWAPNGSLALIVGSNVFWSYDFATGNISLPAGNVSLDLYGVAFRPNGTDALAVGTGGYVGRWDGSALSRVSPGGLTQSLFAVTWHKDASGTGDYASAVGASIVAEYDAFGVVTSVTQIGTFFGVAFLGENLWIAGDQHKIYVYDSSNGIWDNVTLPPELNTVHLGRLVTVPAGNQLLLVGNQSFSAYVNATEMRRFSTGYLASFNSVAYNPVTGEPLFAGASLLAFEMREGTFANLPPTAVISRPANGTNWTTIDTISFDASGSFDPDGDTLSYAWFDNASGYLTGTAAFQTPLVAGNHTLTVFVSDGQGHNVSASVSISIAEYQYAPVAVIASPAGTSTFTDDDNITFSAVGSYDGNVNDTLSFEWTSSLSGSIGNATFVIAKLPQGTHTITLRVTDSTGLSSNASIAVIVTQGDVPPFITVSSPQSGRLYPSNIPIEFDARNTTDPDSSALTFVWSLDGAEIGRGPFFIVQNRSQGTYTLLLVVDDGIKSSRVSFLLSVGIPVNLPPRFLSLSPPNGSTLTGVVIFSGTTEPDPAGPVTSVRIRFEFGDWENAQGNTQWTVAVDSTRFPNGPLNITIRASDGLLSTDMNLVFVVDNPFVNQLPSASVLSPRAASSVRGTVTLAGSADDLDGSIVAVEFRLNGGEWRNATVTGSTWSADVDTGSMANGPLLIEARAFDGYNYSEIAATTVIVDNPPAGGGFLPGAGLGAVLLAIGAAVALARARRVRAPK